jgi:hypothetical protein
MLESFMETNAFSVCFRKIGSPVSTGNPAPGLPLACVPQAGQAAPVAQAQVCAIGRTGRQEHRWTARPGQLPAVGRILS